MTPSVPARTPVRFVFGVHLHQPVGNFDKVFEDHARDVYRPLIEQLERRHKGTFMLHMSGPLLEWLESHEIPLLDRIGRLAADGRIEFLLGGMYEPILAAIPRADRAEQITWHRDALRARFGAEASGLWLTERVWEPELAYDLAIAGVRYALVDDRHFLVTGFERDALHAPYRTESDGRAVTLLAIDERLRYMIPFRPPEELAAYFRELHAAGQPLAVFADDGEKFGGWPGTREWVYERGWFERFYDALDGLIGDGIILMRGGTAAIEAVPSAGLAYLPTASYREMEAWSLPPRRDPAGDARVGSWGGADVRARWRARTRVALAELPHEILGGEPPPKKDVCAERALSETWRSAGSTSRDRPRTMQRCALAWRVRRPVSAAPARSAVEAARYCGTRTARG